MRRTVQVLGLAIALFLATPFERARAHDSDDSFSCSSSKIFADGSGRWVDASVEYRDGQLLNVGISVQTSTGMDGRRRLKDHRTCTFVADMRINPGITWTRLDSVQIAQVSRGAGSQSVV